MHVPLPEHEDDDNSYEKNDDARHPYGVGTHTEYTYIVTALFPFSLGLFANRRFVSVPCDGRSGISYGES